jgi:hypothetical protein
MSGTTGVKISDAASAAPLVANDQVPIARQGSDVPYNAMMSDVATYVTSLAGNQVPPGSSDPGHPGTTTDYARADHQHPSDLTRAPLDSPLFTGLPRSVNPPPGDATDMIATTQWVVNTMAAEPPYAPLNSPQLTGIPTAPQAPIDNATDQLANCAFVLGQASTAMPTMASTQPTAGVSTRFSRGDHVHPADSSLAPLDSPQLSGTPTTPTMPPDTNTAAIASTQFVLAQAATAVPLVDGTAVPGIAFRYSRADHVHPTDSSRAPLNSPQFTGTPLVPLTPPDTNTAAIASTQFVLGQAANSMPIIEGIGASGTSQRYSRADHVHPAGPPAGAAGGYLGGTYPNPLVSKVKGVTDGSSATAGDVGEFLSVQTVSTSAVNLPGSVDTVIATLSLTAGDWDVWASVGFTMTSNNNVTLKAWLNAGGVTQPPIDQFGGNFMMPIANNTPQVILPIPQMRVSTAAATITVALGGSPIIGGGTVGGWGKIMARRCR